MTDQTHWAIRSQHWNRSEPPLRPDPLAVQKIQELVGHKTSDILLLGVTRELTVAFDNVVAVERELNMINNVWLGNTDTRTVIHNDWLKIQFPHERFGGAVGDGSINQVAYPYEQKHLLEKILTWLEPGGVFACRMYTRPDTPITREQLIAESVKQTVNWSAYRRMLTMYLAHNVGQTMPIRMVKDLFDELFPSKENLPWTREQLEMIEAYGRSTLSSCLPTRDELMAIIPNGITASFVDAGDYDLAECCPILTFTKDE